MESTYPHLKDFAKVSLVNTTDHIHNYYDHALSNCRHPLFVPSYSATDYRKKFKQCGISELDVKVLEVKRDAIKIIVRISAFAFDLMLP